jgi:hypothetical protein
MFFHHTTVSKITRVLVHDHELLGDLRRDFTPLTAKQLTKEDEQFASPLTTTVLSAPWIPEGRSSTFWEKTCLPQCSRTSISQVTLIPDIVHAMQAARPLSPLI